MPNLEVDRFNRWTLVPAAAATAACSTVSVYMGKYAPMSSGGRPIPIRAHD